MIWVFPIIRGTPKWMVKIMENPIKMDDLGKTHYFRKHPFLFIPCFAPKVFLVCSTNSQTKNTSVKTHHGCCFAALWVLRTCNSSGSFTESNFSLNSTLKVKVCLGILGWGCFSVDGFRNIQLFTRLDDVRVSQSKGKQQISFFY